MDILDAGKTIEALGLPYLRELSTFGGFAILFVAMVIDRIVQGAFRRKDQEL